MRSILLFLIFTTFGCIGKANDGSKIPEMLFRVVVRNYFQAIPITTPPEQPANNTNSTTNTTNTTNTTDSTTNADPAFTIQNVPPRITVDVPRSIRRSDVVAKIRDIPISKQGYGYQTFSSSVSKVSTLLAESKKDLILLDSLFTFITSKPNECIQGGTIQVKFTQNMVDKIYDSFLEYGLIDTEAKSLLASLQSIGKIPKAGDSVASPAILYSYDSSNSIHRIDYTSGSRIADTINCPTNSSFKSTISFDPKKENTVYKTSFSSTALGSSLNVSSIVRYKNTSSQNKMTMEIETLQTQDRLQTITKESFTMEACNSSERCNKIKSITEVLYPKTQGTTTTYTYSYRTTVEGMIDNSGGYLISTFKNGIPYNSNPQHVYQELFDKSGNLLAYQSEAEPYMNYPLIPETHSYKDYRISDTMDVILEPTTDRTNKVGNASGGYDLFVISKEGCDPNVKKECVIGIGDFVDSREPTSCYSIGNEIVCDYDNDNEVTFYLDFDPNVPCYRYFSEVSVYYFGMESEIPNATVWRKSFDSKMNVSYSLLKDKVIKRGFP